MTTRLSNPSPSRAAQINFSPSSITAATGTAITSLRSETIIVASAVNPGLNVSEFLLIRTPTIYFFAVENQFDSGRFATDVTTP